MPGAWRRRGIKLAGSGASSYRNAYMSGHLLNACEHSKLNRGQWEVEDGDSFVKKAGTNLYCNDRGEQDEWVALAQLQAFFRGDGPDRRLITRRENDRRSKRPLDRVYVNPPTFKEGKPLIVTADNVLRRWQVVEDKLVHLFAEDQIDVTEEASEQ